jgi:ABC-type multidrug transport system ATPase subunit
MNIPLQTMDLGKRYGRQWALRDCSLELPAGRVGALVGPNGAGKTTLLQLAVGLAAPSAGSVAVFGAAPRQQQPRVLPRVGFVAQDQPLYHRFSVAEMLTVGRLLNARWDERAVRTRLARLGIPLEKRVGALSGGQRAQVALALALGKRPDLLLLDEPVASLDPLARREFLQALLEAAQTGVTVLLSSHIIADLERICDYLIILSASRVQLAGDIAALLAQHSLLVGPRAEVEAAARDHSVIQAGSLGQETTVLVRGSAPAGFPSGMAHAVQLEELVLAYLGQQVRDPLVAGQRHDTEVRA